MDYTSQTWSFKVRKALRYLRLYGIHRTYAKVQAQYHMRRVYASLPPIRPMAGPKAHIGLIGCGTFGFSTIAYYCTRFRKRSISGAMDVDINKAASLYESYSLNYYTSDADRVINDKNIDLVYVASNHASHAEYAIKALREGKAVHIEKPHAVTQDQLVRLCRTMKETSGRVRIGFNRPVSPLGQEVRRALDRQAGPLMMNWFVAGHELPPDHWYFKEEEGGRVLGNLCHWIDFVYQSVPEHARYPIVISPVHAPRSDSDIVVTYTFADGSLAVISFSSKGHTFEGIKERLAAHKGQALITLDDFQTVTIDEGPRKKRYSCGFRNHGHDVSIRESFDMVQGKPSPGVSLKYVWEIGDLVIKTKTAIDTGATITVNAFNDGVLG